MSMYGKRQTRRRPEEELCERQRRRRRRERWEESLSDNVEDYGSNDIKQEEWIIDFEEEDVKSAIKAGPLSMSSARMGILTVTDSPILKPRLVTNAVKEGGALKRLKRMSPSTNKVHLERINLESEDEVRDPLEIDLQLIMGPGAQRLQEISKKPDGDTLTGDLITVNVLQKLEEQLQEMKTLLVLQQERTDEINARIMKVEGVITRMIDASSRTEITETKDAQIQEADPPNLPVKSVAKMMEMEAIKKEEFIATVQYLGKLSDGNLRERVNSIVRQAMSLSLCYEITMNGTTKRAKLKGTKLHRAMYAAACYGLPPASYPARDAFNKIVENALKAAKQRMGRSKTKSAENKKKDEEDTKEVAEAVGGGEKGDMWNDDEDESSTDSWNVDTNNSGAIEST